MPPGSPFSRYIGQEVTTDPEGRKWALARLPAKLQDLPGNRYSVVRQGDYLDRIAARTLHQWRYWDVLADINGVIDPTQDLEPGDVIIVPSRATVGAIVGDRSGTT